MEGLCRAALVKILALEASGRPAKTSKKKKLALCSEEPLGESREGENGY